MSKVKVEIDDEAEEIYRKERKMVATVEVCLTSGQRLKKKVTFPKGSPENPMTEAELIHKFEKLTGTVIWNKGVVSRLRELIMNLEKVRDVSEITSLIHKSTSRSGCA